MSRLEGKVVFACLWVVAACGTANQGAHGGDILREKPRASEKVNKADKRREELWQALMKSLPKKYEQIDAYAESPALTAVLLYSQSAILKFSLKTGKIEEIQVMKRLGRINRITFEKDEDGDTWILWCNGRREMSIDDRVEEVKLGDGGK